MNVTNLKAERARLITEARALNERAEKENRPLEATEQTSFDAMIAQTDELRQRIDRAEMLERESAHLATLEERAVASSPEQYLETLRPEIREKFAGYIARHPEVASTEYRKGYSQYIGTGETRAVQNAPDSQGGYMAPVDFIASLLDRVRDNVVVRQLATNYFLTTGDSVGRPTIETDMSDADWTSEVGEVAEDSALTFGKRELHPHDLAKLIRVSRKILRTSAINPETVVRDQMAYKFGVSEEKAFMLGNGAAKPLGVFFASNDGISTARDISTGNLTTSIQADGLINAKYALKDGYLRSASARWIFHRDAIKQITTLKDGEGRYLFQPDLRASVGDTICGIPVVSSEFAPNTFTSAQYVGIIGDFSYYWIATALNLSVQRLVELYARNGQDGFIGRHAVDGMPTFGEAFARVKLA